MAVTQACAAAALRRRRPRLRCCCCCCRDDVELSNIKTVPCGSGRKPRASRRARELAVSLLAGCCRPLGPAAAEGAGPPQAPWASVGHSTPTVSTVCVRMVCVSMCQHPLSQPRQPRDCHVLLRNTQTEWRSRCERVAQGARNGERCRSANCEECEGGVMDLPTCRSRMTRASVSRLRPRFAALLTAPRRVRQLRFRIK